ncbi:hypothetical protein ABEB36_010432 [Hypothenemus hampei]|uniref:Uncharacterized protein n=1 Tax=Hypothenemus hampei TaxID=57062 RepID=A0ABD1EJX0_HYPHA
MISSHDETQPKTPPTSAAISPSLPSSPPPSSTISVEGSVDGPVTGSVDGIVKERIKKRKRTTAEQFLKDAISHYSDLKDNWCKSRLQPNTKKGTFPIGVSVEKYTIPSENEVYHFPGLSLNRILIFFVNYNFRYIPNWTATRDVKKITSFASSQSVARNGAGMYFFKIINAYSIPSNTLRGGKSRN